MTRRAVHGASYGEVTNERATNAAAARDERGVDRLAPESARSTFGWENLWYRHCWNQPSDSDKQWGFVPGWTEPS